VRGKQRHKQFLAETIGRREHRTTLTMSSFLAN
jgi:hypothetical protein